MPICGSGTVALLHEAKQTILSILSWLAFRVKEMITEFL